MIVFIGKIKNINVLTLAYILCFWSRQKIYILPLRLLKKREKIYAKSTFFKLFKASCHGN
jgi:hypothetical protein